MVRKCSPQAKRVPKPRPSRVGLPSVFLNSVSLEMASSITLNGKEAFARCQACPSTQAKPYRIAKRTSKYGLARSAFGLPRSLLQPLRLGSAKRITKYGLARSAFGLPRALLQPLRLGMTISITLNGEGVFVPGQACP